MGEKKEMFLEANSTSSMMQSISSIRQTDTSISHPETPTQRLRVVAERRVQILVHL